MRAGRPSFLPERATWRRHAPWLVAGLAAAVLALLFVFREPIGDRLWPRARAQALIEAGEAALTQGRLSVTDGSGARELFEAALALDPDRDEARRGLQRVGQAALAQARRALAAQRFAEARARLQLARALAVPRAQADALAEELRRREAAVAGIEGLLARAAALRAAGRSMQALDLYQRVLSLQPRRTDALEAREDLLADLLQRARRAAADGALAAAVALVAQAERYDAGHMDLPDTRAQLARAADAARTRAAAMERRGHLDEAAAAWREVLAVHADDAEARAGVERILLAHAARSERLAADFRFAEATQALAAARALDPRHPAVAHADERLAQARVRAARLAPQRGPAVARRVRAALAAAEAAAERGDLIAPPGDSAFDHLRTARALAPDDPAVRRAQARLLPAARRCFDEALRDNRLARARACLDARAQFEGPTGELRRDRRRLAQRWIAVGDERLGAGDLAAAERALAAVLALDPRAEGAVEFVARVRAARATAEEVK